MVTFLKAKASPSPPLFEMISDVVSVNHNDQQAFCWLCVGLEVIVLL